MAPVAAAALPPAKLITAQEAAKDSINRDMDSDISLVFPTFSLLRMVRIVAKPPTTKINGAKVLRSPVSFSFLDINLVTPINTAKAPIIILNDSDAIFSLWLLSLVSIFRTRTKSIIAPAIAMRDAAPFSEILELEPSKVEIVANAPTTPTNTSALTSALKGSTPSITFREIAANKTDPAKAAKSPAPFLILLIAPLDNLDMAYPSKLRPPISTIITPREDQTAPWSI